MQRRLGLSSVWVVVGRGLGLPLLGILLCWALPTSSAAQTVVTVHGSVTTSSLSPIEGAAVLFSVGDQDISETHTDENGAYSVVIPTGTYTVSVTPPPGTGFVRQTQSGTKIEDDLTLDVVLVDAVPAQFSGHLLDGNALPLPGVTVRLTDGDGGFSYSAKTQADGSFIVSASTAATTLRLECQSWSDCLVFGQDSYATLDLPNIDLRGGSLTGQQLVWQTHLLSGTVKNTGGSAVPASTVYFQGSIAFANATGSQSLSAVTNASGQFSVRVSPGDGSLTAYAPENSGLQHVVKALTISTTAPAEQAIVLPDAPRFSGKVVDGSALPIAGATVTLSRDGFSYRGVAGPDGSFDFFGPAGVASLSVECQSWNDCSYFGQDGSGSLTLPSVDLGAGGLANQVLVWQTRLLTGTVMREGGGPLSGVQIAWQQDVAFSSASGWLSQSQVTDGAGNFSFRVSPGSGTLTATAPANEELQNRLLPVTVDAAPQNPAAQVIVLQGAPVFAGTVVDSRALAMQGARVSLSDGSFGYSAMSDAAGAFRVVANNAATSLSLECSAWSECDYFGSDASASLSLPPVDLSQGSVTGQMLVWETRALDALVTDVDGVPLLGAWLYWSSQISWDDGDVTGSLYATRASDTRGAAAFRVSPGSGTLTVEPPEENGLLPFALDRTITDSLSLSLLVQFAADAASGQLLAGGELSTDSEGDGATPADPIETTIYAPSAGVATIEERALSDSGPSSVRFLTQEIAVSVPSAPPEAPWRVAVSVDGSRVPLGYEADALSLYFNAAVIAPCTQADVAAPAPCLAQRELHADGDLTLVVLVTGPSTFNLGVADVPCTSAIDCASDDECAEESCLQQVCRYSRREILGCIPECARDEDCDDGEWCTSDDCQFGVCAHVRSQEDFCQPECEADADCDDGLACTQDECVAGSCSRTLLDPEACLGSDDSEDPGDDDEPIYEGAPDGDANEGANGGAEPGEQAKGFSLCSVSAAGLSGSTFSWLSIGVFVATILRRRLRRRR